MLMAEKKLMLGVDSYVGIKGGKISRLTEKKLLLKLCFIQHHEHVSSAL